MKKFLIIFIFLLIIICINIFSTSFGNEDNIINEDKRIPQITHFSTRNSYSKILKNSFWPKFR